MAPSQLKSLKLSLRDEGVIGSQKSTKQKKQGSKRSALRDSKCERDTALQSIREAFNPFEARPSQREKHEFASNRTARLGKARHEKPIYRRPGVTKGFGEENRRKTLLVEMHRKKKVGGIVDRRFGENDPTMTPEERGLERFVKEKQRGRNQGSTFELEDVEEEGGLTHLGSSLPFNIESPLDEFGEVDAHISDDNGLEETKPKGARGFGHASKTKLDNLGEDERIERPKTKKEVMEEIVAKSKLYKYERQQAKDDDDDLRAEIDRDLPNLFSLMQQSPNRIPSPQRLKVPQEPDDKMNPDRMALLNGKTRVEADKDYDERLRQMAMDQRAMPTVRTLTDEEKAYKEAQMLQDLESRRIKRMKGERDENESDPVAEEQDSASTPEADVEYVNAFGLGSGLGDQKGSRTLEVEDEDDFVIDDGLLASGKNMDPSLKEEDEISQQGSLTEDDRDFISETFSKDESAEIRSSVLESSVGYIEANVTSGKLAYTYCCPETHEDLLILTKKVAVEEIPTIVQRIRALYHPKLASDNKRRLGKFASVLVDHLSYLANQADRPPFPVFQALIRHVHSLAKTFPGEVGRALQTHLVSFHKERPAAPISGDLIILTAIGFVFPTSDHFHQVVTPAVLCMSRYLSQKIPRDVGDLAMGTFICSLCLHYQRLSKRYIPEVINYVLDTLWALVPGKTKRLPGVSFHHDLPDSLHLHVGSEPTAGVYPQLCFWDIVSPKDILEHRSEEVKQALFSTQLIIIDNIADLWVGQSAFCEIFDPIDLALGSIVGGSVFAQLQGSAKIQAAKLYDKIHLLLAKSVAIRKPLSLHNHRPLAIKTSYPKFEESYNPDKHYDPDRNRAELSKLKAEHKQERKGALRELRKDANFIARESLREKKEQDEAYEKRQKRLIAEIQGDEGREAKIYDREKRLRKGRK